MYEDMIDDVVTEVLRRLGNQANVNKMPVCVVIGNQVASMQRLLTSRFHVISLEEELSDDGLKQLLSQTSLLVMTDVSVSNLSHIALGTWDTLAEKAVALSLLQGKEIIVLEEGMQFHQYKAVSSKNYYRKLLEYEELLIRYGIKIMSETDLTIHYSSVLTSPMFDEAKGNIINKNLILEKDLMNVNFGISNMIQVPKKAIITPMALDYAKAHHLEFVKK